MLELFVLDASLWLILSPRAATGTAILLIPPDAKAETMFEQFIQEQLLPIITTILERLMRFYQERLADLTRLYEVQIVRLRAEMEHVAREQSERMVVNNLRGIWHWAWELICLNVAISILAGIVLAVLLFFYVRYKWRRWRWEPNLLQATLDQNALIRENNRLMGEMLKNRSGSPEP